MIHRLKMLLARAQGFLHLPETLSRIEHTIPSVFDRHRMVLEEKLDRIEKLLETSYALPAFATLSGFRNDNSPVLMASSVVMLKPGESAELTITPWYPVEKARLSIDGPFVLQNIVNCTEYLLNNSEVGAVREIDLGTIPLAGRVRFTVVYPR